MPRRSQSKRAAPSGGALSQKAVGPKLVASGGKTPPKAPAPTELDALKGEILQLVAAANAETVAARAQVGKMLIKVKGQLQHGEWLFWLNDHVPFTAATAKRAIQLWHLSQSDPEAFEALRPLGLTKAYKLMSMAPAERDAFLGKAHAVPGSGMQTPLQMTFAQMMMVLHPPKPETEVSLTTKLVKTIRRQTLGLGRLLADLWEMVPSLPSKAPVEEALGVLAYELEAVVDQLEGKSLIEGKVPSFG